MKKATNIIKMKLKKNKIWILLITLIVLLSQSLMGSELVRLRNDRLMTVFSFKDMYEQDQINDEYWYKSYKVEEKYKEKYKELIPQRDFNAYISAAERLLEENQDLDPEKTNWEDPVNNFLISYRDFYSQGIYKSGDDYKINITSDLFGVDFWIIVLIFAISVLLTSGEHMTKYYEFIRMLPWSKTTIYLTTQLLAAVLSISIYLAGVLIKYFVYTSGAFSDIVTVNSLVSDGLVFIPIIAGLSVILISIGTVAGNFIGHGGMSIIGILGINLFVLVAGGINYIFTNVYNDSLAYKIDLYISELSPYFRTLLSPADLFIMMNLDKNIVQSMLGIVTLAVVYGLLGLYWSKTALSQRSGQLVMKPVLSNIVQFIAVVTTGTVIFGIFGIATEVRILGILIWLVGLVISHIFYKRLFNINIGI